MQGGLLVDLLILLGAPGEEKIVELVHHQSIMLDGRVDMHRVIVDELAEKHLL